jgi:hypothetical protein
MAEIKVEDLMRSIRAGAREGGAQPDDSFSGPGNSANSASSASSLGRLETSLTITRRTHDQLPPVTTYRSGFAARVELWIKRRLKRVTHWFTWEQVNFNSSTHSALNHTLAILQTYEQRLASLQNELDASVAAKANLEARLIELESSLASAEGRFEAVLAEKTAEIGIEHRQRIEMLLNDQRICFKQLALEISEAGVIADRAKRSMQLRLEELANRVDEMSADQSRVSTIHEITRNFTNER